MAVLLFVPFVNANDTSDSKEQQEEDKILPQAVILTEPTNLSIKIGQRGRMEMKL